MIRIRRGPEPQAVVAAREEHLSRAALEAPDEGPATIEGYEVAKPTLYERQFSKCAYCESWEQQESQATEHFRPKGRPSRVDWTGLRAHSPYALANHDEDRFARGLPPTAFDRVRWPDPSKQPDAERGYWWLAWTWENLVFGCQSCNGKSRKGSRFPLARGTGPLGLHDQPPGGEQPLLLDPTDARTDPMDFIRFGWDGKHWRPFAHLDDVRAAWTIAVFGLAGPSLLTAYAQKVATLDQMARAFRHSVAASAPEASIRSEWTALHQAALTPGGAYLALAHDWLAETFAAETQRFELPLARPLLCHPTATGDATRLPPLPRRPELDGLSERLQCRVRVGRNFQGSTDDLRALLVDICRERPSTTNDLVSLLGRPSALPEHLRALEGLRLVRDPATDNWIAAPAVP
jgi:hypothetical protein